MVCIAHPAQESFASPLQTFPAEMAQQSFFIKDRIPAMRACVPSHKCPYYVIKKKYSQRKKYSSLILSACRIPQFTVGIISFICILFQNILECIVCCGERN